MAKASKEPSISDEISGTSHKEPSSKMEPSIPDGLNGSGQQHSLEPRMALEPSNVPEIKRQSSQQRDVQETPQGVHLRVTTPEMGRRLYPDDPLPKQRRDDPDAVWVYQDPRYRHHSEVVPSPYVSNRDTEAPPGTLGAADHSTWRSAARAGHAYGEGDRDLITPSGSQAGRGRKLRQFQVFGGEQHIGTEQRIADLEGQGHIAKRDN